MLGTLRGDPAPLGRSILCLFSPRLLSVYSLPDPDLHTPLTLSTHCTRHTAHTLFTPHHTPYTTERRQVKSSLHFTSVCVFCSVGAALRGPPCAGRPAPPQRWPWWPCVWLRCATRRRCRTSGSRRRGPACLSCPPRSRPRGCFSRRTRRPGRSSPAGWEALGTWSSSGASTRRCRRRRRRWAAST